VLAQGADWPNAALGALYKLPEQLDGKLLQDIQRLDEKIATRNGDAEQRLKVGIIAVLARSGDEKSAAYLREIWERDPDRRQAIALGMAQVPGGENWEYLVRSLAILEGESAREVLIRLQSVDRRPTDPEQIRQVILRGLALKDKGGRDAVALLELWTGERLAAGDESWEKGLAAWQQWFSQKYPDRPRAELPVAAQDSKWKFDELLQYLTGSDAAKASAERGEAVFSKAQCIKCHRYGDRGESMGPDLTTVSKRFMKKEVLESVLYPSHVISDRYAAKTIITNSGRQYSGIVAAGSSDELVILQADGQKRTVDSEDIEQVVASKQSAMPEGLLNPLTLEEIADLFAYLGTPPRAVLTRRTPGDAAR
jgi:putative heme-binding domain-containing protein